MRTSLAPVVYSLLAFSLLLMASCRKSIPGELLKGNIIYVMSNDYHQNQNAILAYERKADGSLKSLPGSPFYTHGSGVANPTQGLGPDDSDDELILSPDGHFLLAVNSGSNTIAVFEINVNGALTAVPGSPFPSGGETPCSLAISGQFLFVANKSLNPLQAATINPNYVTFNISPSGWVDPSPVSTVFTTPGSSPAQVLVSEDHNFVFGCDFLGFMLETPVGTLRSFAIQGSGALVPAPGTPEFIPGAGGALGLAQRPNSNVLYAGFPVQGKIGVYAIDPGTGTPAFQSSVVSGGGVCWLKTNKLGDRLYALNSGENSVSIYNTTSALSPQFMTKFVLKDLGPLSGTSPSSADFSLQFSPDGKYLYVVSQSVNTDFALGNFNYLHELPVAADGTLTEPGNPVNLPVPADVRPEGIAVD